MSYSRFGNFTGIRAHWSFADLALGAAPTGIASPLTYQIPSSTTALVQSTAGAIGAAGTYGNGLNFAGTASQFRTSNTQFLLSAEGSWTWSALIHWGGYAASNQATLFSLLGANNNEGGGAANGFLNARVYAYGSNWRLTLTRDGAAFQVDIIAGTSSVGLHHLAISYNATTKDIVFSDNNVVLGTVNYSATPVGRINSPREPAYAGFTLIVLYMYCVYSASDALYGAWVSVATKKKITNRYFVCIIFFIICYLLKYR